jgi:hypothetical protein
MAERLDPTGGAVQLGDGVTLRTPGLSGTASVERPTEATLRSTEESWEELEEALGRQRAETEEHILVDASETLAPSGEAEIELTVPAPPEGSEQVVLLKDEAGVLTWNFAEQLHEGAAAAESPGTRTYTLRGRVAETPEAGTQSTFLGAIGKKVLKVIAFKVLDDVLGRVGDFFAGRWEARQRPYRLRRFTPDDYTNPTAAEMDGDGWRKLGEGRALLLIHGTFSRADTAFGELPRPFVERLTAHYGGRVFALDHPTMSETPRQNADWLLSRLPSGAALDVDVLCHSRGGLVARVLSEQLGGPRAGSPALGVHDVVFVATPNAGTVLADFDHLGDLVDSYTNLLHFVPGVGIVDTLETILTVIKMIAVGGLQGLDGLTSMTPGGRFLTDLNAGGGSEASYHALASDYEPPERGLKEWATDQLMDPLFKTGNDLVVPADGVWSQNGSPQFPIEQREVFETAAGVAHTGFFGKPRTQAAIAGWLGV